MSHIADSTLKVLVCIASYGRTNDQYLARLICEYRSMHYRIHIVVLSNEPKDLGENVEVIVGLPSKNPWSLPFGHKQLFVDRLHDYDLFVYSEDDTLITEKHIDSFIRMSAAVNDDEVPGFLRFEKDDSDNLYFPEVHLHYHWLPQSVRTRGDYSFACFTNLHAACYILTRAQLTRAIRSGGFLVPPHQGEYDLLVTAATDPYTQCNLTKLVCISHLDEILVHHLPNKYVGRLSMESRYVMLQLKALLETRDSHTATESLVKAKPRYIPSRLEKNYYEPVRTDLIRLIPTDSRNILSVGCGWGATEEHLVQSGKAVTAIPLDSVIASCAISRGVNIVRGNLNRAVSSLAGQRYDAILISNVLHLMDDPSDSLMQIVSLLAPKGVVLMAVPNLWSIPMLVRICRNQDLYRHLGNYEKSGVHFTSHRTVRTWLTRAGLRLQRFADSIPGRGKFIRNGPVRFLTPLVSSEIVAVATRADSH